MRLSKIGYYADFIVYPALLLALGVFEAHNPSLASRSQWILALAGGTAAWSLVEYLAHRFVLHVIPPFRRLHALHHRSPTALIGTPTWLSVAIIGLGVFAPLWDAMGFNLASGLTAGFTLGYVWYVGVHHAVHRWRATPGSYLHRAKRRHAWHHLRGPSCNFGVTTDWWDRAFGSARR